MSKKLKITLGAMLVAVLLAVFGVAFCRGAPEQPAQEKASVGEKSSARHAPIVGTYSLVYSRPCRPGLRDVSVSARELAGDHATDPFADATACGTLGYETG